MRVEALLTDCFTLGTIAGLSVAARYTVQCLPDFFNPGK